MRFLVAHMLVVMEEKGRSSRPLSSNLVLTLSRPSFEVRFRRKRTFVSSEPYTWPTSRKAVREFICWRTVLAPKMCPVLPDPQAGAERKKGMHSSEALRGSFLGNCWGEAVRKQSTSILCMCVCGCECACLRCTHVFYCSEHWPWWGNRALSSHSS